jgi:hypothetical protein
MKAWRKPETHHEAAQVRDYQQLLTEMALLDEKYGHGETE